MVFNKPQIKQTNSQHSYNQERDNPIPKEQLPCIGYPAPSNLEQVSIRNNPGPVSYGDNQGTAV